MAHRHTDITQDGGVRQVALQTADGQLGSEELQDGIGDAEVTFSVLVVDGVHLMGHGTGAHLAGLDLLFEVVHGDIHPEVAAEVDDDGVDTAHGVEDGAEPVVVADLRGILLTLQAELVGDEGIAELPPVVLRIGHMVGVEVAGSPAELRRDRQFLQSAKLLFKAVDIDHHLLAKTGGRCGLTVGLGQHGNVLPLLGIVMELFDKLFDEGVVDLLQSLLHGEGNTGVVDILGGQTEVDELLAGRRETCGDQRSVDTLLDEVLHGLHVVVRHFLYILDALGIGHRELAVDVAKRFKKAMVKFLKLW